MTHISLSIFQGLFRNVVFRSVATVTKKWWAILDFLVTWTELFTAMYFNLWIKKINCTKYPLIYFSLKVKKKQFKFQLILDQFLFKDASESR